jgi:hypothetical protein
MQRLALLDSAEAVQLKPKALTEQAAAAAD